MKYNRKIGKVTKVRLGMDRGVFLTLWLHFDFGGSAQGFGGFILCEGVGDDGIREGTAGGADYIRQVLTVFDVDDLNDIVGRHAYALYEGEKHCYGDSIKGVESTEPEGSKRFTIADWQERWFPEEG